MRDGSVMASLPCDLKGQTVYLLVFQLLFIYYIVVWKKKKRDSEDAGLLDWCIWVALFCSIKRTSNLDYFSHLLIYIKDAPLFNCVGFDEETVQLLSCTSGVFVISFSIDMHQ